MPLLKESIMVAEISGFTLKDELTSWRGDESGSMAVTACAALEGGPSKSGGL